MRKYLVIAAFAGMMLSSCDTLTKTAATADIASAQYNATAADLKVADRISYTMTPSKAVQRGGMSNVKQAAEHEALEKKGGNADILLEPQFVIEKKRTLFGSKVTQVTVSGRPATYTNFRSLDDSVWCNPVFRGVKVKTRHYAPKATGSRQYMAADMATGLRRTGIAAYLNIAGGYVDIKGDGDNILKHEGDGAYVEGTLSVGYQPDPHWYFGIGSGVSYNGETDGMFIPIFAHGRYSFSPSKNSFFIDCKIGKSCGKDLDDDIDPGLYLSPSIGYSFGWFDIALQYTLQKFEGDYAYNHDYRGYDKGDYKAEHVGISFGFRF